MDDCNDESVTLFYEIGFQRINTEGNQGIACSKVFSYTKRYPSNKVRMNLTENNQCHLWGLILWLPKYMAGARKPQVTGPGHLLLN